MALGGATLTIEVGTTLDIESGALLPIDPVIKLVLAMQGTHTPGIVASGINTYTAQVSLHTPGAIQQGIE